MSLPRTCVALAVLLACDGPGPLESDQPGPEVADIEACEPAAMWPEAWSEAERALLGEINAVRATGGQCGALRFSPAPPLAMHATLRCAARLHTADMIARAFVTSVDPDGLGLGARLTALDYDAATFTEAVAVITEDHLDPADDVRDVITAWRDNPTSCWQLYARELTHVGIGGLEATFLAKDVEEPSPAAYWTLSLAAPR